MALSNIFREPRREITESGVGMAAFLVLAVVPAYLDYRLALTTPPKNPELFWIVLLLVGPAAMLVVGLIIAGLLIATHAFGDGICNALERRGLHLRPRVRR